VGGRFDPRPADDGKYLQGLVAALLTGRHPGEQASNLVAIEEAVTRAVDGTAHSRDQIGREFHFTYDNRASLLQVLAGGWAQKNPERL